jgi:hypothetical protein
VRASGGGAGRKEGHMKTAGPFGARVDWLKKLLGEGRK